MKEKIYTILGVDPGTRITGYGIIQTDLRSLTPIDFGTIRPPQKLSLHERYLVLYEGIQHLLNTHQIYAVSIESQFVGKNPQTALKLGRATGMCLLPATQRNLPVFEYTPKTAKLAVTGSGSASKEQVQGMVQLLLGLSEAPDSDPADALSLAITHAHRMHNTYTQL